MHRHTFTLRVTPGHSYTEETFKEAVTELRRLLVDTLNAQYNHDRSRTVYVRLSEQQQVDRTTELYDNEPF